MKKKFAIPKQAFSFSDLEAKYEVYALTALSRSDVSGVVTANPSSLLKVCLLIEERGQELLGALNEGSASSLRDETQSLLPLMFANMNKKRVKALLIASKKKDLTPQMIWPRLKTIATWTGGSCGIALSKLLQKMPPGIDVAEYGYGASEFMGSANIDMRQDICLPLITDNFYEFVARDEWDAGGGRFLGLHEVEIDQDYYVFVTTRSGLYRYDINDVVRIKPGYQNCPALQFIRKGKGVTSITGEKLSEDQVISAVTASLAAHDCLSDTYLALADEDKARYRIYLELPSDVALPDLAEILEEQLRQVNGEYDDKRASGRLMPVLIGRLRKGAGQAMKAKRVLDGVRESQYKPTVLAYWSEWAEWIKEWIDEECE